MQKPKGLGVVVGRFQVPQLHDGHHHLLDYAACRHERLLVVLGVPASLPTKRDPLSFALRKQMLLRSGLLLGPENTFVEPLLDRGHSQLWSEDLDRLIAQYAGEDEPVVLYGSRESFLSEYCGRYQAEPVPELPGAPSGSDIRAALARAETVEAQWGATSFRAGYIAAVMQKRPVVYQAVDIAVLYGDEVLLAQKVRDDGQFRFIGGHVDVDDASLEAAALRELQEEAGLSVAQPRYLGSAKIDDWRYRHVPDKIFSSFFVAEYVGGEPVAGDDIDACAFVPTKKLSEVLVPEHQYFGELLTRFVGDR